MQTEVENKSKEKQTSATSGTSMEHFLCGLFITMSNMVQFIIMDLASNIT